MRQIAAFLMLLAPMAPLAPMAHAEGWQILSGPEISTVLSKTKLQYADASQVFYASGRTLYSSGRPSWGYWRVEGDQYCSQWPPGDLWACYGMARLGDILRFIAEDGSTTDGTIIE